MINRDPKIVIEDPDIYVEATDIEDPYDIEDFLQMSATDAAGNDISDQILYDSTAVDYSKAGDYTVPVTVMDSDLNMSVSSFCVHVLNPEQTRRVEKGRNYTSKKQADEEHEHRLEIVDRLMYGTVILSAVLVGFWMWADMFL